MFYKAGTVLLYYLVYLLMFLKLADDLKLFFIIRNETDISLLQKDHDSLWDWCKKKLLDLNIDKYFQISFNRKNIKSSFNTH